MRSSTRRSERAIALLCALLFAAPVHAAPKTDTKEAVELSRRAIAKYRAKRYEEAGELFLRSYQLSSRPAQLRNAAKAYEEGDVLDRALSLWETYRALGEISRDEKSEAEAHVALIRERKRSEEMARTARQAARSAELARRDADAARRAAEAARAPTVIETTPPPSPATPPIGGWVLVGAGAIMVVTSVALWFVAQDQLSAVDDRLAMTDAENRIIGTTPAALASDLDRINGQRIASGVLLPIGLSAALGGTLWLIFGSNRF